MSPYNISSAKVEEYKRKLEEWEKQQAVKAKEFNPDEFLVDPKQLQEVFVPEINRIVKFRLLTIEEMNEAVTKAKDNIDASQRIIAKMLGIPYSKAKRLRGDVLSVIMQRIDEKTRFLTIMSTLQKTK